MAGSKCKKHRIYCTTTRNLFISAGFVSELTVTSILSPEVKFWEVLKVYIDERLPVIVSVLNWLIVEPADIFTLYTSLSEPLLNMRSLKVGEFLSTVSLSVTNTK